MDSFDLHVQFDHFSSHQVETTVFKAMFTQYQSRISPVENLRGTYCLHGTISFFARKYLLFTRDRLFEIVLRARSFFFSDLPREHAQINPLQRDGAQKKSCRCRGK